MSIEKIFHNINKSLKILLFTTQGLIFAKFPLQALKQEIPVADRILPKIEKVDSIKPKNIMVIDNFTRSIVDIDFDFYGDVSHGFITSGIIEKGAEKANVFKQNYADKFQLGTLSSFKKLSEILSKLNNDTIKYDAINLSCGKDVKISDMGKEMSIKLSCDNLKQYRDKIRQYLSKSKDEENQYISEILDKIDSLTNKNTRFYISAGNEGEEYFNLLNLAKNTVNVGALESDGTKAAYSSNNSLINRWENGSMPIRQTDKGWNVFGGKQTDILPENTTSRIKITNLSDTIKGTSFSAPRAIVKDFGNMAVK